MVFIDELTRVASSLPEECVSHGLFEQIPLAPDSDEFKSAAKRFWDANLPELELVTIYKIKAPHLESHYNAHKIQLLNQYKRHKAITDALEREVFHGTKELVTSKILAGGFDPKFGSLDANRAVYGFGCYFAPDLKKSSHDTYAEPNEDGHKFVFIANLLVGATFNVLLATL